ncbi:glycosyltransferase family 2 protein [Treponema ruminis]|uniref:Glycosyltransferase involved in cell wall biosynthesis n=1 Tax=Treponema ruminis TaxID=744515 RepID=A0A7W8LKX6_9SPIR|nr:glycosyltransferase family 2 protein [Treponema ruminis]MBB5224809.1 glycosyltransferase involved in cell wall biosynthesis [Treponema ruminis]
MNPPLITVCIPVFQTEPYLAACLRSVYMQDFDSFEVVVLSDRSPGKDEKGRSAKKIVKLAQKECDGWRKSHNLPPVKIRFCEHRENRGCVEVRRTLVYESKGKYLAMIDSDDEYMEGALSCLYEAAISKNADIVHGTFVSGEYDSEGIFHATAETKCGRIFYGTKDGLDIARSWFSGLFNGNVCGKLIEKSVYEKAFEQIPYTECNMADDLLIFFFVGMNARRYVGIENKIYRYRINSGMSSHRKIDTLKKWKMICTSSSVFSIISQWLKENNDGLLSPSDIEHLGKVTLSYLANNIRQLRASVIPELQEEAKLMLYDFWGESFVKKVENALE